ncbi:hypothetical protein D9M70_442050 [compost metagenome]
MELLDEAADRVDFGDALDRAQLRADDPVLHFAQVRRRVRRPVVLVRAWLGLDRVHEDLAKAGGDRTHCGCDVAW